MKVRALQKSLKTLQDQVQYFKSSSKEHRRSALIQQLRVAVKEQEEVVDVLKQRLVDMGEVRTTIHRPPTTDHPQCPPPTTDHPPPTAHPQPNMAVNELIIKKTCAGPKRFRPRTREELQVDCEKHTKENARLLKQVKALKNKLDSAPAAPVPGAGPADDYAAPNSTLRPGPIGLSSAPSPQMPLLSPVGKEDEMLQEVSYA